MLKLPPNFFVDRRTMIFPRNLIAIALVLATAMPSNGFGQTTIAEMRLRDARGDVIEVDPDRPSVVCFLGTECPLARLYGPRLQGLADKFAGRVNFVGVVSNVQDSPADILQYVRRQELKFPIAKDADQQIAQTLKATRTPEVFVLSPGGEVLYQGRIDNQYEPGVSRATATRHDLREALVAVTAGRSPKRQHVPSVGCRITFVNRDVISHVEQPVTFADNVSPILRQHCVECHRAGEIGPMELVEYDEVVGWGDMMLEVIDQGRMPPWHADPTVGEFDGARKFPDADKQMLRRWVNQGMPAGDLSRLGEPPVNRDGRHFDSPPDVELAMGDRPFRVPAEGIVEYQYYVVDPGWKEDRWVRAAQVIPGASDVVHHAIVFVRPPDGHGYSGIGWLGAYVPGQRSVRLPKGYARRVPANSKLVFQMHYTPTGRTREDISKVCVWFADETTVTHQVNTHLAIDHEFEIPPGKSQHVVRFDYDSLPRDGQLLGITPHMHLRGRSFDLAAVDDEGRSTRLLHVPVYDFNWQHWYQFAEPIPLRDVAELKMTATFDNSRENPFNPDADEFVSWGDQTWQEMAVAFFDIATPQGSSRFAEGSGDENWPPPEDEIRYWMHKATPRTDAFFVAWDKNRDGVVVPEETTATFREFGFSSVDDNKDGRIERKEYQQSFAYRLLIQARR